MATNSDETLNTITNDQYGMLEAFQEFTASYFPTVTPDNIKIGLFGYLNEITAHVAKAGTFQRILMYNEGYLNTASLPSTIYSAAIDEDIDPNSAVPAKATLVLSMSLTDLNSLLKSKDTSYIILNRETVVFTMDDVEFRLPYSVIIRKSNLSYSALYRSVDVVVDNDTTLTKENQIHDNFSVYSTSPFIPVKTVYDSTTEEDVISFRVDVYQYSIASIEETVYTSSLENRLIYSIDYTNELMGFTVRYKKPSASEYEVLETYQNKYLISTTSDYCYYKYLSDTSYQIFFDMSSSSFRPEVNSSVRINTYTTQGASGNITYTTFPQFSDSSEVINFDVGCSIYVQPHEGKDKPSLSELKTMVFKERQKVYHRSSEQDLNDYFSTISETSFGDGSKIVFVKTRDDVLAREWTGYGMLMDENTNPFPTNTLDIKMTADRYYISCATPLVLTSDTSASSSSVNKPYLVPYDDSSAGSIPALQEYINDVDKFIYFSPYSIYITDTNNVFSAVYFDENINETVALAYERIESGSSSTPVINYISEYRNPAVSDIIQITVPVTADNPSSYRFILFMYTNDTTASYWMELSLDTATTSFIGELSIGKIIKSGKILINGNSDYPIYSVSSATVTSLDSIYLAGDVKFSIFALEKTDSANGIEANFTSYDETYQFGNYATFDGWRVKAKIVGYDKMRIFEDMGSVVRSDVTSSRYTSDSEVSASNFWIKSVPVAGANVLFSTERYNYFITQLRKYTDQLADTVKYLTNNTSFNTRFYNTYGPSLLWSVSRTNVSLSLEVEREDGYDDTVDTNIRELCKDFIQNINTLMDTSKALNNRVSLSNLSTKIEQAIPSIDSCNILSVNEIFTRKIERLESSTGSLESSGYAIDDVPEYLTIDLRRNPSNLTEVDKINVSINYIT